MIFTDLIFFFLFYFYVSVYAVFFFFFFQAEDGIRDGRVTGVQTCALPISRRAPRAAARPRRAARRYGPPRTGWHAACRGSRSSRRTAGTPDPSSSGCAEIGRASCRERG